MDGLRSNVMNDIRKDNRLAPGQALEESKAIWCREEAPAERGTWEKGRKRAFASHLASFGLHAPSPQPRQRHHPVHFQGRGKGKEEDRKAADTEVWLPGTERFGRLGNTTPLLPNRQDGAEVTQPVWLGRCLAHSPSSVAHAVFFLILAIPNALPPVWLQRQEAGKNWSWLTPPLSHPAHWGESAISPTLSSKLWFFSLTTFPP